MKHRARRAVIGWFIGSDEVAIRFLHAAGLLPYFIRYVEFINRLFGTRRGDGV